MIAFIAGLLAGFFDRVRGGYPEGRPSWLGHVAKHIAGGLVVATISNDPRIVAAGAVLVGLASWRQDNGWRGDWVRGPGYVRDALRWGALWAAPLLPLVYWEPRILMLLVGAPLGTLTAMFTAQRLPACGALDLRNAWPWSELIELPIIAAVTGALLWLV